MHNVKDYNCRNTYLFKKLINSEIVSIQAQNNAPIERDCINIIFNNKMELYIYCFFRIIEKGRLVLGVSDFYYNESSKLCTFKFVKKLKGLTVERVIQKQTGDIDIYLNNKMCIQILIDITKTDADFYDLTFENKYCEVCNFENKLIVISGEHEEEV